MSKLFHSCGSSMLVIVESPAKCKKIEQYLGPGYRCLASFGHLRELPSLDCIDVNHQYKPTYRLIDNSLKKKQIITLRNAINESSEVILATDDDREGEAIAWHLCQIFDLNVEKTKRIVFHEITEEAIQRAIQSPRQIDMNLVNAQQCRQILDLLVGFKVTPILWKYISRTAENSLSAGRCQTPALKLIYDNQQEIDQNPCQQVYNITGYFTGKNIPFELNVQIESGEGDAALVTDFLNHSISFQHFYSCSSPMKGLKTPPEPFTTSRLQQVASNELHYSPKETMKLCQTLYEAGHITYMRTDSKIYSAPFLESVKNYVSKEYGDAYLHAEINRFSIKETIAFNSSQSTKKSTNKLKEKESAVPAQEAHEAIRPTHIEMRSLDEETKLTAKERKMYQLIWRNTLESCMSPASYYSVTASITAPPLENISKATKYTYSAEKMDFLGWKVVSQGKKTTADYFQYLQTLGQNKAIAYSKLLAKTTLKNQLLHYTEARLVQLLEEKGIGRPSTFSTLVDKIQERGYVKKQDVPGKSVECKDYELENNQIYEIDTKKEFGNEKNKLVIQPLGVIVIEFLMRHFTEVFNYDYTRRMEEELDHVARGIQSNYEICQRCDQQLDEKISSLKEIQQERKVEIRIDDQHFYIIGKHGPVIKKVVQSGTKGKPKSNVTFLPLKIQADIHSLERGEYKLEDLVELDGEKEKQEEGKEKKKTLCPLGEFQGNPVFLKKGKFGLYVTYGEKESSTQSMSSLGNRPLESIQWEEVIAILNRNDQEGGNGSIVRKLSNHLSIRKSKKGEDYLFFKTEKMKRPQFFDIKKFDQEFKELNYKNCDLGLLTEWIKKKYSI